MSALLTTLVVMLLATSAGLLYVSFNQSRITRRQVIRMRSRRLATNSRIQKKRLDLLETRNRSKVLEDTVKSGTAAVEKMHRTLTNATFGLIDRFSTDDEFKENARRARETHDQTSEKIYKTLHTTNKAVHLLADTFLTHRTESRIRKKYHKPRDDE